MIGANHESVSVLSDFGGVVVIGDLGFLGGFFQAAYTHQHSWSNICSASCAGFQPDLRGVCHLSQLPSRTPEMENFLGGAGFCGHLHDLYHRRCTARLLLPFVK